ncbi:hypothetical protein YB29_003852 [Salmonella enterica subsp. enterica]|nr:hypothetical protein [Salmonella enterica subsp. enterica]EDV1188916.1 hypothetical protein [Salmonella enterica subsp. enterica]
MHRRTVNACCPSIWARDGSPKGRDAQRLDAKHNSPVLRRSRETPPNKNDRNFGAQANFPTQN